MKLSKLHYNILVTPLVIIRVPVVILFYVAVNLASALEWLADNVFLGWK